ncbi:MAG: hypothetical protein QOE96_3283 [Blastocatellia bacterium]|jgi:hypothetical protein|nr:hypothetical protein [Blastocatellia bacterium]
MSETHSQNPTNGAKTNGNSLDRPRDWSFAKAKTSETLWGPHGYHRYPAKFIPQLVRQVIEQYSSPGDLIADTFLGSGTSGVEALRCNRQFWGIDINPIAVFISRVKCTPLDPTNLDKVWLQLSEALESIPRIGRRFLTDEEKDFIASVDIARANAENRFNYWFPVSHTTILDMILDIVLEIRNQRTRNFFLCAFSNSLRSCSIWLSGSTKPQKDVSKQLSDPVERFCWQARDMLRRNRIYWNDLSHVYKSPTDVSDCFTIRRGDARRLSLDAQQLDLLVTSSPYATCYQYLELHQLSQLWFERRGIIQPVKLRNKCIGGYVKRTRRAEDVTGSPVADRALSKLASTVVKSEANGASREVNALRKYFTDMNKVLQEAARVVAKSKYLVMVIGDSIKRGVTIPTSQALTELADDAGFDLERKFVRKVAGRVLVATRDQTTGRFSSVNDSDTQAYPEEDVLIFKRRQKT